MLKNITIIMALAAALPSLAQEAAPHWGAAGQMPSREGRPDMHQRMLEKFDADKDGKLSDVEKEAMKAEFGKRGQRPAGMNDKRAPRPEGMEGKFGPRPEGKNDKRAPRPEGMEGKFGPRPEGKDRKFGPRRHRRGQRPEGMPQEPATLEL